MPRHAILEARLHADQIRAFGLDVRNLDVPIRLKNGLANVEISGVVNEGQMHIVPVVDFNQESAVLTLASPSNLLHEVQLTDQLSEELLSKIHPLFKGASAVTGKLNLGLESFSWPLDPAMRRAAQFEGRMQLTDLHMSTHGLLQKILEATKVRERDIDIGSREVQFSCENERITCSPLKFEVSDHQVMVVGSMGLDQTLDYSAQLPVTRELVGGDAYKYLEGTTIRVPIRGTATNPELNQNILQEATGDLLKQAAQKAIQEKAGKLLEGLFDR